MIRSWSWSVQVSPSDDKSHSRTSGYSLDVLPFENVAGLNAVCVRSSRQCDYIAVLLFVRWLQILDIPECSFCFCNSWHQRWWGSPVFNNEIRWVHWLFIVLCMMISIECSSFGWHAEFFAATVAVIKSILLLVCFACLRWRGDGPSMWCSHMVDITTSRRNRNGLCRKLLLWIGICAIWHQFLGEMAHNGW